MSREIFTPQGSIEWEIARSTRINTSELAGFVGLSSYKDPGTAINEKITRYQELSSSSSSSSPPHPAQANFDHGHKFEYAGLVKFIEWMQKAKPEFQQDYTLPSGYQIPLSTNKNFPSPEDEGRFGASLDGKGNVIDVEIKNPVRYLSFKRSYSESIQVEHYVQCQWAMAIRQRESMFYVATHFDPETEQFLAIVVWLITFNPDFFHKYLYPGAIRAHDLFSKHQAVAFGEIPWLNENKVFEDSLEWKEIFQSTCKRYHYHIEGRKISLLIKERTGR